MSHTGKLRAWIEPISDGQYRAAYISAYAVPGIRPGTRLCASRGEARRVVDDLATSVKFDVEWVERPAADA